MHSASLWWDTFFKRTKEHPSHILPKPNEKQQNFNRKRKKINFVFCCSLSKRLRDWWLVLILTVHEMTARFQLSLFQVLWNTWWPNKFLTVIYRVVELLRHSVFWNLYYLPTIYSVYLWLIDPQRYDTVITWCTWKPSSMSLANNGFVNQVIDCYLLVASLPKNDFSISIFLIGHHVVQLK